MKKCIILISLLFNTAFLFAQDLEVLMMKAEQYYRTEQNDKLSAIADTLLKINKKNPVFHFLKATALDGNPDRPILDKKLYDKIITHYDKSIKYSNGSFFAPYIHKAVFLDANLKYEEAVSLLNTAEKIVSSNEDMKALLINRSGVYLGLLQNDKAKRDLRRVLEIDKNYAGAYINLGMIDLAQEEYESAKENFLQALKINPKHPIGLNNMGYVLTELGEYEAAIDYCDQVLELDIELMKDGPYNNRGFAKFKLGKVEEAIADIEKSLTYNPQNSFAYRNLAEIYNSQGEYEKACENVQKAKEHGFLTEYEGRIKSLNALCIKN